MELKDKVVIITGSSSGIGQAAAIKFAKEGAKVVINYKSNKAGADQVMRELKQLGDMPAIAIQADVADPVQVKNLFSAAVKKFGTVDILINNAGLATPKTFFEITKEDLITETEKNYFSFILC
ncbi:MAG: SDR family NAD(P)-dependent oxidoreductase [Patescibacteria group bacterium]|nr:SDR family NAD(P)-dependent oxidoreductase [Patescibacteria group bacterium]